MSVALKLKNLDGRFSHTLTLTVLYLPEEVIEVLTRLMLPCGPSKVPQHISMWEKHQGDLDQFAGFLPRQPMSAEHWDAGGREKGPGQDTVPGTQ